MTPRLLCSFANGRQGNGLLTLPGWLLLPILLLTACATSNAPLQYTPVPALASRDRQEDQEKKLTALPLEELLVRGNQYLLGGNAKLARVHFQMAVKKNNDSAAAYAGMGEALAMDGENQAAQQMLARALVVDPTHRRALLATGKLFRSTSNYDQAEVYFNRAMASYPEDPEILTELAITSGHLGREEQAETLLLKVAALKPQDPAALNNLGFNYLLQKKYADAIRTLQKALAIKPDDARIQDNLAAAYALSNKSQQAFDLFSQSQGEAAAYNNLGYFYMVQGLNDSAKFALEKALLINPRYYVRAKDNLRRLENGL